MTLYRWKPRFQALLRPAVTRLARSGVTANGVTVAAAAGSVLVGAVIALMAETRSVFLLLPAWCLVRMALNAVDGMLAREFHQKSRLGAYLNELADVVSDAVLLLPLGLLPAFGGASVALVVGLSLLTEFAGVLGLMVGASRRYDGPLGKSDRALVMGALGLWIGLGLPLPAWSVGLMGLVAIGLAVTVVNRVRAGLEEASAHAAR
ncbi:MAG: CDP-alcohol phosphatidyltransferase family protein [Microvirga sp.]